MEARKVLKPQTPAFQISLRIRHPSMDPALISRELLVEPEHCFRAGETRRSPRPHAHESVHVETYWLAALSPASWLPDVPFTDRPHLNLALQNMSAAAASSLEWTLTICAFRLSQYKSNGAFLKRINAEGGSTSLLIALSSATVSGFNLAPDTSRMFGELGVTLEFEITGD
jgi:hypothetical protein